MNHPCASLPGLKRNRCRGITLLEVVVALGIVAILAAVALPRMTTMLVAQRLRSASTDVMSSLLIARSEAIKRGGTVRVAPLVGSDWTYGWVAKVTASNEQIDLRNAPGYRVQVTRAPAAISYERSGRLSVVATTRIEFSDSAGDTGAPSRCVTIEPSGLPRISRGSCS